MTSHSSCLLLEATGAQVTGVYCQLLITPDCHLLNNSSTVQTNTLPRKVHYLLQLSADRHSVTAVMLMSVSVPLPSDF